MSDRSWQLRLAAILKRRRERAGLSQHEVAESLGVAQSWVSNVENGVRRIDLIETSSLARALGSSLGEIVAELEGTDHEG
jgi:transcriptional regulator with XRE-family HTH domain